MRQVTRIFQILFTIELRHQVKLIIAWANRIHTQITIHWGWAQEKRIKELSYHKLASIDGIRGCEPSKFVEGGGEAGIFLTTAVES